MYRNLILCTDSYKASHWLQYPPGTSEMFSYIEARTDEPTLFFGLQAILLAYLSKPITGDDIDEAAAFFDMHGVPFNRAGWELILNRHDGYLPVRIKAVPEGMIIPGRNVLATVESTDPDLPWVGGYIEALLLRVWYPTTVATRSFQAKMVIAKYMDKTAGHRDGLEYKLHDFGARGVSSGESAGLGGMAHLVNFAGSDTVEGVLAAMRYYGDGSMPAHSIPAAEHSTITSWGRDGEAEAYRNILKQYGKPGAVIAVVSDSYDIFNACDNLWGGELRQEVIASGSTLVIRPDSGDPVEVVTRVAQILDKRFGSTTNKMGYRVLNNVRIIQGDGLDDHRAIEKILRALSDLDFSAENIAFGMGGGLLQKINRDTFGFAMKCSAVNVDGIWRDVYKDPVAGGKTSKKGRLTLIEEDGGIRTASLTDARGWSDYRKRELLRTVYENGALLNGSSLSDVRLRTDLW